MDPQLLLIAAIAVVVVVGLVLKKKLGVNPLSGIERSLRDRLDAQDKSEVTKLKADQQARRTQTARDIAAAVHTPDERPQLRVVSPDDPPPGAA